MAVPVQVMDVQAFRRDYPVWLEMARPALNEKRWKDAFALGYPYPRNEKIPWTPVIKSLAESRLGLLTTAGLYLKESQPAFDAFNYEGDWTHRLVPLDASAHAFSIAHDHYDHTSALADLNSVLPADRLRELVAEGVVKEVLPTAFSISGYCTRADQIAEVTAANAVEFFRKGAVDAVLLVPV